MSKLNSGVITLSAGRFCITGCLDYSFMPEESLVDRKRSLEIAIDEIKEKASAYETEAGAMTKEVNADVDGYLKEWRQILDAEDAEAYVEQVKDNLQDTMSMLEDTYNGGDESVTESDLAYTRLFNEYVLLRFELRRLEVHLADTLETHTAFEKVNFPGADNFETVTDFVKFHADWDMAVKAMGECVARIQKKYMSENTDMDLVFKVDLGFYADNDREQYEEKLKELDDVIAKNIANAKIVRHYIGFGPDIDPLQEIPEYVAEGR